MKDIKYKIENNPNSKDDEVIRDGINEFNNKLHNDPVSHHSIFAKCNGKIIGDALVYQHSDAIYIDSLWVDESYRRQGIATTLLKKCEQDALEKGILKQVICTIYEPNRHFYQSVGFELIATVPEYIQGLDKYYLQKVADKTSVKAVYNKISGWFDDARTKDLSLEKKVLALLQEKLPRDAEILDVGCGTGEPIARFFIENGYSLVGIDNSEAMIQYARNRFPSNEWLLMDMREIKLNKQFDCIIAWHSFFHLQQEDQEAVLINFQRLLRHGGLLVFTSGLESGEIWSNNGGGMLFHASLSTQEYQQILKANNMSVLEHQVSDPDCGDATYWIAQKR